VRGAEEREGERDGFHGCHVCRVARVTFSERVYNGEIM
jgi:hypothetical protein